MERVVITKSIVGIAHMQVCAVADATDEEILEVCNRENPSGTSNGWVTICRNSEPHEFWRNTMPMICKDDPGRRHFLVAC